MNDQKEVNEAESSAEDSVDITQVENQKNNARSDVSVLGTARTKHKNPQKSTRSNT